jgi:hypothetical protein
MRTAEVIDFLFLRNVITNDTCPEHNGNNVKNKALSNLNQCWLPLLDRPLPATLTMMPVMETTKRGMWSAEQHLYGF